jgi:hypothetical protein
LSHTIPPLHLQDGRWITERFLLVGEVREDKKKPHTHTHTLSMLKSGLKLKATLTAE